MLPYIRNALETRRFFKLICCASYRNSYFVATLADIFTQAGAHVIDVGANPELVKAARQGIQQGMVGADRQDEPLVMVSVGINQDVHFLRVEKDWSRCDSNGYCVNACPHEVFVGSDIRLENCLGCDYCVIACPTEALTLIPREPLVSIRAILESCLAAGATALEIHTGHGERAELEQLWQELLPLRSRFHLLAFSLGAHNQSPAELIQLAQDIIELAGSDIIIQADGKPISGRKGELSTLPCLELAKTLLAKKFSAYIQVSGGTNNLTGQLARAKAIPVHGVGMGSFARKYIDLKPSERQLPDKIKTCIQKAKELVLSV